MNDLKKHSVFISAITAIIIVIGGSVLYQESILQTGETTILATRPIDPRDLLRGEYVILRYELEASELVRAATRNLPIGSTVYIQLSENTAGIAEAVRVAEQAPVADTGLWITGEVGSGGVRFPTIEQFYVPEGAGTPIENLRTDLHVEVVLKDGRARVVQLLDANLSPIDPSMYLVE